MIPVHVEKKERFVADPEDERILLEPVELFNDILEIVSGYENA